MLSVSLGLRYIDAYREAEGSMTFSGFPPLTPDGTYNVKFEEEADGWGGIIGVNISPADEWNIGIKYETKTSLEFETDQKRDDFETFPGLEDAVVADGDKYDRDLPALLGLGVSYKIAPNLKADANLTYYFNEDADWDGEEDVVDDGYDIGVALEYTFTPQIKASAGYMYTYVGDDAADQSFEEPKLDAHSIAGGVAYEAMPGLNLNFGIMKVFYQDETTDPTPVFPNGVKLEKDAVVVAIGVQYKF
jgi:long-chain fatty acid transport protein